jgi:hypothetical protein
MVKLGFVVEDDAMRIVLESANFQKFINDLGIISVGIFSADGRDWFRYKNDKIGSFINILKDRQADYIFFLMDKENDICITYSKENISNYADNQIDMIVDKAVESWFLADSSTLSKVFNTDYYCAAPESNDGLPFEKLRDDFMKYTGRGISKRRNFHTKYLISKGFSVVNAANHNNCKSANYFLQKLKNIANNNNIN